MTSLLSPKLDLVFKLLFVSDPALLRDLLNQVLRTYDYPDLQTVTIRNPTLLAADLNQKFVVLDIHALDDSGRAYDIEMQVQRYHTYPSRTLYYLASSNSHFGRFASTYCGCVVKTYHRLWWEVPK